MTDLPMTKADDDLVEPDTWHCPACGAAVVDDSDEIERLRSQLAAAEAERDDLRFAVSGLNKDWNKAMAQLQAMRKALEEIAEGKGRYSQDRYEHACNTIEDMKELARESLRSLTEGAGK